MTWLREDMQDACRAQESVINLKEAIGDDQIAGNRKKLKNQDSRVDEMWMLTGKTANPMHAQLLALEQNVRLHQMHRWDIWSHRWLTVVTSEEP